MFSERFSRAELSILVAHNEDPTGRCVCVRASIVCVCVCVCPSS